jgi:hypothetical protein
VAQGAGGQAANDQFQRVEKQLKVLGGRTLLDRDGRKSGNPDRTMNQTPISARRLTILIDVLKTNTVLEMKSHGVEFATA